MSDTNAPAGPPLDYETPKPKPGSSGSFVALLILALVFLALMYEILIPSTSRSTGTANRVRCAANLRQIGQAILMYTNENHGVYPDSLATLLITEDITSGVFVCPNSNDEAAAGPTTQAIISNLATVGHLSYVYVGVGWTSATTQANAVVAYESLTNHDGDGMNVLFGDGHVGWLTPKQAKIILANAGPGKPPVTLPAAQ